MTSIEQETDNKDKKVLTFFPRKDPKTNKSSTLEDNILNFESAS